jgi:hypothetical protein
MHVFALSRIALRVGMSMLSAAFLIPTISPAQVAVSEAKLSETKLSTAKAVISLETAEGRAEAAAVRVRGEASFVNAPANFHSFTSTQAGEVGPLERLNLHFEASTKLTKIESTKDFVVEQGSSCVEGNVYNKGGSCMLLVRFAPQGAGKRLGKIKIEHTASATPFYVGLGGNGYAPVASFTPAVITTVPASYPANTGLLSNASSLTVDGGDTLYMADTGNNVIRAMDSSGVIKTVSSGTLSSPYGVAVDTFGEVFFDEPAQNAIFEIFDYGSQFQLGGAGTDNCTTTTTCSINSEKLYLPGQMSIDPNNQIFMVEQLRGAMVAYAQPYPAQIARLYDPFTFQNLAQGTLAVDAYDNIYSLWSISNVCQILSEYFSDAANSHQVYKKIAGGKTCGFAGDGGQARNAEIGAIVPQMVFDVAGNLYFSDSANQRVRRIDASTGIINTIAGTGTAGYGGDNGMATAATLSAPTGVTVDSQGQVYIISAAGASGSKQVIRKLGVNGMLAFGNQTVGTASAAKTVTVSNTGNSTLTWTSVSIKGINASDFTIDPNTTSCNLTAGSSLANGQSCVIGVIFKAGAAGNRSASVVFLDNTVTNSNTVLLSGTGGASTVKTTPTITITSPAANTSVTAGTAVSFAVKVSSASGPVPTGTVKFALDGVLLNGSAALVNGVASMNVSSSVVGTHTLGTAYNGDTNYNSTGSTTRTFTVTAVPAKAPAVVKLSSTSATVSACKPVTFSVAVMASTTAKPTGTVVLKDGATVLGSVALSSGTASFSVPKLAMGAHAVTASYGGDATHAASTSAAFTETVNSITGCAVQPRAPVTLRFRSLVE